MTEAIAREKEEDARIIRIDKVGGWLKGDRKGTTRLGYNNLTIKKKMVQKEKKWHTHGTWSIQFSKSIQDNNRL